MSLFGRIFQTRQQRRDAKQSCAEAAASGADTRSRLFSVVDRLEAEMGQLVIAFAQKEGVLMTHPRLTEELHKLPDGATTRKRNLALLHNPKCDRAT
jgi:hypothetical protein